MYKRYINVRFTFLKTKTLPKRLLRSQNVAQKNNQLVFFVFLKNVKKNLKTKRFLNVKQTPVGCLLGYYISLYIVFHLTIYIRPDSPILNHIQGTYKNDVEIDTDLSVSRSSSHENIGVEEVDIGFKVVPLVDNHHLLSTWDPLNI